MRGARTSAAVNETPARAHIVRQLYTWRVRPLAVRLVDPPGDRGVGGYRIGVRLDDGTTRYVSVGVR